MLKKTASSLVSNLFPTVFLLIPPREKDPENNLWCTFLSHNLVNYTLFWSVASSHAKLSMLRDRGPRGGGCLGGSLGLFLVGSTGLSSPKQGFQVSPDIAARK